MQQPSIHVLIYANSGGAIKQGKKAFEAMRDATSLPIAACDLHEGDGFMAKMEAAFQSGHLVLVGGGDGTIAYAANLALKYDKPFGILALGTMNMIARDLGVPPVAEAANIFDLYTSTQVETIDVGIVNGRPFLCAAAMGAMPAASRYREKFRHAPPVIMIPRVAFFFLDRMSAVHRRLLRVTADGRKTSLRTTSLVVSNNLYAPSDQAPHKLAKQSLHANILGIYVAKPTTFFGRLRLLFNLQRGALEADPALSRDQATQITVTSRRRKEWVSIDGEPVKLRTPIEFSVRHNALKIIVPAGSHG